MHAHFSGLEGVKVVLYVVAIMGTLNLLAMKYKESSSFWASWANLWGLT